MCAGASAAWSPGPGNGTRAVHQMLAAGHSLSSVSRTLSLDRKTVQRSARQPDMDKLLVKATSRDNKLNPFKPWINQRWNQGITDAAALHTELQARGWTGSVQAVRRYVPPVPRDDRRAAAPAGPAQGTPDHQLAAPPPGEPQRRRAGTPARDPRPLPAHRRPGRPRDQLRRDDDPPQRRRRPRRLAVRRAMSGALDPELDVHVAEHRLQLLDLVQHCPLARIDPGLPPSRNCRFQVEVDCSLALPRRAASAIVISAAMAERTSRYLSSTEKTDWTRHLQLPSRGARH